MNKCDICGQDLSDRETDIYADMMDDELPCYCNLAKRVALSENIMKEVLVFLNKQGLVGTQILRDKIECLLGNKRASSMVEK